MDASGNASSGSKASPKRRAITPRGTSTAARPKRSPNQNARAQLSKEQLLERLEELEKYKAEEEKGRKKEDSQRKKDLLAAKKKLTREITTAKGIVRKRNMEAGKLKQQLHKLEVKADDSMKKKTQIAARFDETVHKSQQKHNQTEVELAQKIGEMGEARGTLAYLEYAQEMLEKGIMLPRNQQAELQAAQMGRLRAIASHESAVAENLDSPEEAQVLAYDLEQMREQFDCAEEQRLALELQNGDSRAEWQEELQILRGEVGQLRDENLALRQRLDAASGTAKAQDDCIETLRTRLQDAPNTMKENVERIEELTETVVIQADPMSSSSEGFLDVATMEQSRHLPTDVSLGRAADEAGGFIGHTPSKQDHSFAGSSFIVATEAPAGAEANGTTLDVGELFHVLPESSETNELIAPAVPMLVGRASAASGLGAASVDAASGTFKAQDFIETLRTRLQDATNTTEEKVECIEELTETVVMQADPMSSSSEGFLDGATMERSRHLPTDVSLGRAADEAGGLIGHTPSKQDHSSVGSSFIVATEAPAGAEANGTIVDVGEIFHVLPEASETNELIAPAVPMLAGLASAASGLGTESATNVATAPIASVAVSVSDTPPMDESVHWQMNGGQGPFLASARHAGSTSGSLKGSGPSGSNLQDQIFDRLDVDRDGLVSRGDFKEAVKSGLLVQGHAHAVTPRRQRQEGFATAADVYAVLNGAQAFHSSTTPQIFVQSLPTYGLANAVNVTPLATDGSKSPAATPRTAFASPPAAWLAAPWLANSMASSPSSSTLRHGLSATRLALPLVSPPAHDKPSIPAFVNAAPNASAVSRMGNFRSPSATPRELSARHEC